MTVEIKDSPDWSPDDVVERARGLLWVKPVALSLLHDEMVVHV